MMFMRALADEDSGEVEGLLGLAVRALDGDGDLASARQRFDSAFQAAERCANAEAMAQAALGMGGIWVHERRTLAASATLRARLEQVLPMVERGSATGLRVCARLAAEADYRTGEHAKVLSFVDQVRSVADPIAGAEVRSLAHHCVLGPDHGGLRRELAADMLEAASRSPRRIDMLMATLWQTVNMFLDGDPHALRRFGELQQSLRDRNHLAVGFVASAIEVMLAIRAGKLRAAEDLARVCAARGTAAGDIDATGWLGGQMVAIRWYEGRLPELLPMLNELVHSPALSAVDNSCYAALAVACAQSGDMRTAASLVASLRGRDLADLPRSSSWLVTMNGLVEAAYLLSDTETAARVYELLKPFAALPMLGGLGTVCFGSTEQALGVACLTTGDLDAAVAHLRAAVQRNLGLAHWPAVVSSRTRYAQALARRDGPGDAELARSELAHAADDAAAVGVPVPPGHTSPAASDTLTCHRQGGKWRLSYGTRSIVLAGGVGLLHLAVLIANPGQEIHSADLVAGVSGLGQTLRSDDAQALRSGGAQALRSGGAQALLDRSAIEQYRARLAQLGDVIDELSASGRQDRAAEARAEREWLMAELSSATGLAGRTRTFQDGAERARIAVGKAIRRALEQIAAKDHVIEAHLRESVHTGMRCVYRPGEVASRKLASTAHGASPIR
ncbi:hypothetical protein [Nonomuraea sp. NPDC003754]